MMKKQDSQKWFYIFAGLLTLSVMITGCGKGCKGEQGVSAGEKASMKLISSDHNFLVGMNWKKLEASPFGDKMKEKMPPELIPLSKGIESLLIGFEVKGVGKEPENFVAIISGKIDQAALLAEMKKQSQEQGIELTEEEYNGVKIYSGSVDPTVGMAFVDNKGIAGKIPALKKSIDLSKQGGASVDQNQNLMDLTKAVDMDRMIWAVGEVPEGAMPGGAAGGPGNPMGALSGVKAIDLAMDLSKDLNLDLGIIAGTPEDAQQMQTMANSYKTLFGTSLAQKNPNIGKVLEGLQINSEGTRVAISLKLDEATVEELSKQAQAAPALGVGEDAPMGEVTPPAPGLNNQGNMEAEALPTPPAEDS